MKEGLKSRACEVLSVLQRLAISIVALIVCAGVAVPGLGSARLLATAFDASAHEVASAEQGVRQLEQLHGGDEDATRAEVALKVVESDGDEDGDEDGDGNDPRWDVTDGPGRALRCAPLRPKPDRASRGDLSIDTSRFTAGPRLPRGPPVSGT